MNKKIHRLAWNKSLHQIVAASRLEAGKTVDDAEAACTKFEMLLEVLGLLFDFAGEHAMPILGFPDGKVKVGTASTLHGMDWVSSLIPLLSAGLDDKAIARELDVSSSTLSRRIRDLMSIYGVHTRFQLGLQIARSSAVASK